MLSRVGEGPSALSAVFAAIYEGGAEPPPSPGFREREITTSIAFQGGQLSDFATLSRRAGRLWTLVRLPLLSNQSVQSIQRETTTHTD
jgi:hypothetical protein